MMRAPHRYADFDRVQRSVHLTRSTSSTRRMALRSRCTKSAMRSCLDAAPCLLLLPPLCSAQHAEAIICCPNALGEANMNRQISSCASVKSKMLRQPASWTFWLNIPAGADGKQLGLRCW